jgi:ornithine cyclodeaminase/alanine dehydrogenase-like protein (mu-crystallin family)
VPADLLFVSQEDVVAAGGLDMDGTIEVVEEALRLHAKGEAIAPKKSSILWSDDLDSDEKLGRIMAMPAYVGGDMGVTGVKWIPSVPDNATRGLPRGIGVILLSDRETGMPIAVLDGTVVSAMRTGAIGGIAARALANPGSSVVTLLGAGVQARTQLMALERTLPLEEVRIHDVGEGRAAKFCEREHRGAIRLVPVDDPAEACAGSAVVVAATMADRPFVPPEWLDAGAVFVSISSLDPTLELISSCDVLVTDVWEHETGHHSRPFARALIAGIVTREQVTELGQLLIGNAPGRTSETQRVLVSPVGLGIEDVAEAWRIVRRAKELGIGTPLRLWQRPVWT